MKMDIIKNELYNQKHLFVCDNSISLFIRRESVKSSLVLVSSLLYIL